MISRPMQMQSMPPRHPPQPEPIPISPDTDEPPPGDDLPPEQLPEPEK